MPSEAWLRLGDPLVKEQEVMADSVFTDADKDNRISQLKKQRRRAIRRCLSLEGCMKRLLKVAAGGTEDEILGVIKDCQFVMGIPLHNAITGDRNAD